MKKVIYLKIFAFFLFSQSPSLSQTTLAAGDIAIVAYAMDNPDELSFVCLKAIESSTVIYFTDNGWKSDNTWRSNEGVHTWTASQNYSTGEVVYVTTSGPALSSSGDQIIAFQGSGTTDNSATMIFGLQCDGSAWDSDATTASESAIPNGLTNGTNAIAIPEADNGYYNGTTSGTTAALLSAICNTSNWTTNNSRSSYDPSDDGPSSFSITVSIAGTAGFRLMSTPVSNGTYTDLLAELWTQGMTGSDAAGAADDNVWGFTLGSGAAGSWSGVSNLSATMTPGAGFLVYVFTDTDNDGDNDLPVNLSVSGSENSGNVTYPASGSIDASQYGLAGNPYYTTIDFDDVTRNNVEATVYVYDDAKSGGAGYINWNGSSGGLTNGLIAPFQGFWVQATGSGSASIQIQTADKSTSSGTFYRMLDTEEVGGMHLDFASDNGGYSKTWFSYRSDGEVGKDSRDAHRLMPLMATSRLAAMSFVEDNSLDINNLPFDHGSDIHVPLDVMSLQLEDGQYVTSAAEVTIGWDISQLPDHIDLTLIDELTGEHVDLRHELDYTFITEPKGSFNADYDTEVSPYPQVGESRFTLHTSYGALDNKHEVALPSSYALDPIYPNPFNPRATVRFDVPEVSRVELEVYDITGSLVETLLDEKMVPGGHQYTWEPKSLSTGVYFLRLITASQTFTQKVTYVK